MIVPSALTAPIAMPISSEVLSPPPLDRELPDEAEDSESDAEVDVESAGDVTSPAVQSLAPGIPFRKGACVEHTWRRRWTRICGLEYVSIRSAIVLVYLRRERHIV